MDEAQRVARAAEAKWVVVDTGGIADGGRFAHMLLEAFVAVHGEDGDPHWLEVVQRALVFVHDKVRDAEGRYPSRWDRPTESPLRSFTLIDEASAARAYFVAARALDDAAAGKPRD